MKGAQFERDICRVLSLWWSEQKRDDLFWRTSQSGGRATVRQQKGLRTAGSYGDIAALDPEGESLLRVFTIELKRGNSHGNPFDSIESISRGGKYRPFEQVLWQAAKQAKVAGSLSWMVIQKRDFKFPLVYLDFWVVERLGLLLVRPFAQFNLLFESSEGKRLGANLGCVRLEDFLKVVHPEDVRELL